MLSTKLATPLRNWKFMSRINLAMDHATTPIGAKKLMMCTLLSPSPAKAKKVTTTKSVKTPTKSKAKPSKPLHDEVKSKRQKSCKKTTTPDWSVDALFSYLNSMSLPILGGMAFLFFAFLPEEMPSSLQGASPHSSLEPSFDCD